MTNDDLRAAENWFFEGEIGISSETLCRAFLGRGNVRHGDGTPSDCDDLARCRLFLENLSESGKGEALSAVAKAYPDWGPLVREWDRVCVSMDRECRDWRKPSDGRWGEETYRVIGVLRVEGLRARYPNATITTGADGTLSSMFNDDGPGPEDIGPT